MSDLILDTARVRTEGEELSNAVKALCRRFENEKGWPRDRTASALLSIVYGFARSAGWSADEVFNRAADHFSACEQAFRRAKTG